MTYYGLSNLFWAKVCFFVYHYQLKEINMHFTYEIFRPIEECLQNNLYRECVLQINPKTYEYSVCKSSEAIPGNDVYPLTDIAYPDIGKMHCDYQKLHEILEGYFYVC